MNILQRATGSQANTNNTMTLTPALAITAASSLVLWLESYRQVSSVTDSKGNAWAKNIEGVNVSGVGFLSSWLATGAVAGSTTLTITQSYTGTRPIMASLLEVNAALTFDRGAMATAITNAPTVTLGPQSPIDYLAVGGVVVNGPGMNLLPPPSWTLELDKPSGLIYLFGQLLSRQYTYSAPLSATWAMGGVGTWAAGIAAYVASSSVPTPPGSPGSPLYFDPLPLPGFPLSEPFLAHQIGSVPSPPTVLAPILQVPVVPSPADDDARLEEALRKSAQVLNDLLRSAAIFLDTLGKYQVRGRGLSDTRDPTAADNYTLGVGPCTPWVNRSDPSNPTLWFCTNPGSDSDQTATWKQAKLKGSGPTGVTGAY